MLSILKDPEHDEYEDMLNWVGGDFDPEKFEPGGLSSEDSNSHYE